MEAEIILASLKDFGFASINLTTEDFLEEENVIQLGYPPNRIDLLTSIDGVRFSECFSSSKMIDIDGVLI